MKIILSTFPTLEGAESLAKVLLEKKIVACVQIQGPVKSMYNWKNELMCEQEWKVSLKTKDENTGEISRVLHQMHPYDIPQWIVINGTGSLKYEEWVTEG